MQSDQYLLVVVIIFYLFISIIMIIIIHALSFLTAQLIWGIREQSQLLFSLYIMPHVPHHSSPTTRASMVQSQCLAGLVSGVEEAGRAAGIAGESGRERLYTGGQV